MAYRRAAVFFYSNYDASQFSLIDYKSKSYGLGTNIGFPIDAINRINFGARWIEEELSDIAEYEQTRVLRRNLLRSRKIQTRALNLQSTS